MNMEQLKEFVALENKKRELDAELKATNARLDELENALVPQFLSDGVGSMRVDGRTVYIAQDIFAGPLNDRAEVIAALKSSDLGQYVAENYNTQSLKAYVREIADEIRLVCQQQDKVFSQEEVRKALPEPLRDVVKISFVHSLRSRKA